MNIRETLNRIAPESEAVDLSDLLTYAHGYLDAESKYRRMIEAGELVEVVRCKDCKYYVYGEDEEQYYCRQTGIGTEEDHYCAYGERLEE